MPLQSSRLPRWLFAVSLGIMIAGLFREAPPEKLFEHSDKVGHLAGFALLTITGWLALYGKLRSVFILLLFSLAIGSEFIQAAFLPERFFSAMDMLANLAGIALAAMLLLLARLTRKYF